jgi:hypothetical protein
MKTNKINKSTSSSRLIKELIIKMYEDHLQYPQLKLPKMQADRLMELMDLVK